MEFEGKLSSAEGQRELKREQVIERAVAEDSTEKRNERKRGEGGGRNLKGRLQKVTGTLFLPKNISPLSFLNRRAQDATLPQFSPRQRAGGPSLLLQKERIKKTKKKNPCLKKLE